MSAKRKMWATSYPQIASPMFHHESKAATYRYVSSARANWEAGALRSPHLTVYVDERDGGGWRTYEQFDLRDQITTDTEKEA